ncbi:DUF2065 domain-containing protein [Dyella telluris]|uniref:DUF2065 domain-containing protein n=1 Tax=Dyella telluris TaxID=2763498 RepID=A0A7G8Q5C5_9GAMM|nr:DUF2065 domain-containing protein [Dyella telluris]QNK01983.1 DUF2065 domain-containing protein [Dyella telluris]
MSSELAGALCLVLVIEGLVLFAMPRGWQATMREAVKLSPRALRVCGAVAIIVGLAALQLVH